MNKKKKKLTLKDTTEQNSPKQFDYLCGVALKIEEVRGVLRGMMDDEDESTTSSLMRMLLVQMLAGISAATRGAE